MARKKGNKAKAQAAAATADPVNEPPSPLQPVDANIDPEDISGYPEVQQNEFLATQAIYPDEFVRVRGRKDAWKNQENLAFQVQLTSLENPEFFVKLDFEFPRDYPKVPLKVKVIKFEPDVPKIRTQLENITTSVTKAHIGSECVHEVTGAIDEVLNRSALSKAEKANPFSLEEERAKRENAARIASLQAQAQLLQHQQEAEAKGRQQLASQLDTERKRREDTNQKAKMPMEWCKPVEVDFERTLYCSDTVSGRRVSFTKVDGRAVILRRSDKINRLVSPQVADNDAVNLPALLLKEITLRHDLIAPDEMQSTMMQVEKLLQRSCGLKDENVVDIIGYKLLYPDRDQQRENYVLYILSEWSDVGSLGKMIQVTGRLPPEKIREYTRQILQALWFYEANNFVHPAVHSNSVIVFLSSVESIPSLRLSDGYGEALRDLVDKARDKTAFLAKSLVPPKLWNAPELNDPSEGRSAATAIWDLGRIILEMTLGKSIYDTFTSPKDCLKKTPFERNFSNVLYRMFRDDPSKRPTADALRSSGFLSDHGQLLFDHVTSSGARSMSRKDTKSVPSRWDEEWENLGRIGKGGGGSVFRARKLTDQVVYAVKHIKVQTSRQFEEDRSEILNLAKLQHPSIVRYYDAWAEADAPPDDDTDSETSGQGQSEFPKPPSSMTEKNSEMMDYLVDELSKQGGQSKLDLRKNTVSMRFRGRSSPPPPPPRFQPTYTSNAKGPYQTDSDERSDESDDDEAGGDDDSDDYDNAFAGDARVDPKLLKDEVPGEPRAAKDPTFSETDSQAVEDESAVGGVAVSTAEEDVDHLRRNTPNRRRRSTFERGTLYIQMEFCEGRTLKSLIGPTLWQNVDQVWELLRGILIGLAYIHGENIAHRDLKPDNIFLGADNTPKIGDFGLATANAARKAGSGVGTFLYIAPELVHGREISDMSKVDMFSLGIMLFEMTYPVDSGMERGVTLGAINQDPEQMPRKRYEDPKYQEQGLMIRRLISHKPAERPSASELLQSGKIPEPVEEGKLERRLAWMAQHDPKSLSVMLTKAETTDVQDLAWEHVSTDTENREQLDLLSNLVQERLEATFRKHGAVSSNRQVLLPKTAETSEKAVVLFNPAFMSMQLRKDLTTPFARSIAKSKPQHLKSFCFGDVYESRHEKGDAEPKHNPRANFDFVSSKASDIALKEASTLYVVQDIIRQFPPLASLRWTIILNHLDLMDLILDHCSIRKEDWLKVKELLSRFNYGGSSDRQRQQQWKVFEKALRTRYNIADTSVAELGKFIIIKGQPEDVREALRKAFRRNATRISQAMGLLQRLEEIITYLDRLQFSLKVLIAPLSNSDAHLYAGSVVFECIDEDSGQSLANGGRYDSLIERHARVSKDPSPRAVGFSINVASVAHMLTEAVGNDLAPKGKAKLGKVASGNVAAVSAPLPARVDVLVTSFDAELLTTRCLDVLRDLWAAGVSAELTEEVESMEQLEELHADDGPYWLAIVRVVGEEVTVKARSPGGDEQTVEADGLAAWLRVEVRREKKGGK